MLTDLKTSNKLSIKKTFLLFTKRKTLKFQNPFSNVKQKSQSFLYL